MWSLDFIISAVIFCLALALILFAWSFTSTQTAAQGQLSDMESIGLEISDSLVRTPGQPQDWNSTSVQVIGLASDEGVLDQTKVDRFVNLSYEQAKQLLGLGLYEFYFELRDLNGTLLTNGQNLTAGTWPQDADLAVPVQRFVLLEQKTAKLKFVLWV